MEEYNRRNYRAKIRGFNVLESSDICRVLQIRDDRVSAVDKFFLISVLGVYKDAVVNESVKRISERIKMSDAFVTRSRDVWEEIGVVKIDSMGQVKQKGRRKKSFRICVDELDRLKAEGTTKIVNAGVVRGMFMNAATSERVRIKNSEGNGDLNVNSLVLLGVLVMLSDNTGYLSGHGIKAIGAMAGLKRAQFNYALESLIAKGVVRNYLPGFAGHYLFGKREGFYWLNLGHGTFGDEKRASVYVLDRSVRGMFTRVDRIYSSIRTINVRFLRGTEKDRADRALRLAEEEVLLDLPEGCHRFFLDIASPSARQHLKCFLAEHACFVLEKHIGRWPEKNADVQSLKDGELIGLIRSRLGSEAWLKAIKAQQPKLVTAFAEFLAGWVIWIAADAMNACLESFSDKGLGSLLGQGVRFRMYLNDEDNNPFGGLSLGVFPAKEVGLEGSLWLVGTMKEGEIAWRSFDQEVDLDEKVLEGVGLRQTL